MIIEDLSAILECVTFETPRSYPKWYEFWKWGSTKYMTELKAQRERTALKLKPNVTVL